MNNDLNNYLTAQEASKELKVQYYTLVSWIKKDVEGLMTDNLAIKKSSWLIHKSALPKLRKAIDSGKIHSRGSS